VLPFVNAAADPNTEYLSDGITESLINSLSQLPKLRVMSRGSVFRYKGRETDPQAVGRELKVQAVLTGRLVQRGESLSISAELVDARDSSHIWGQQYNRRLADILAVQEDISREITDNLRLKLSGEQQKGLAKRPTQNTEAYQDYLKGRYYWNKRTTEGLKTAIEHFERAIAKDPAFALGYAGLSDCYVIVSQYISIPPQGWYPKAKAAALKALEIDDSLVEVHAALGHLKISHDMDWAGAEREYKRALELNPGYANAHHWYAMSLSGMGRHDEALAEIKRAQELDPLSLIINANVGFILYNSRRYEEAIEQLRKGLAMDPNFAQVHEYLGFTYLQKSMFREAVAEFQTALKLSQGGLEVVAGLGHAYALSGNRAAAQKLLGELRERSSRGYSLPWVIAVVYIGLGDKDHAFEWLQKAVEERNIGLMEWIKVSPMFDPVRSDPRFTDLLRRMNLAP
jgi:TolB-like protein/Flp pilus assembly protein TadD